MKSIYKRLGNYIQRCDEFNNDMQVKDLLGISNGKYFQKSHTNTIGVDLSSYRIVRNNQFAFNRATTRNGDKISIALRTGSDCIVSPSYRVFQSIDETVLNSEYLMMWFRRPEFDRYARFKSHGSAHEFFDWEEMCEVEIPLPSINKQLEIVNEFNTIVSRIKLNEILCQKLEETAQALYKRWFVDFEFLSETGMPYSSNGGEMVYMEEFEKDMPKGWETWELKSFGLIVTGKTPSGENPEHYGYEMQFVTPGDFNGIYKFILHSDRNLSKSGINSLKNKVLPPGSVIVTCIGSDMGKVAIANSDCITNQQMNAIIVHDEIYSDYLYYYLKSISKDLKSMAVGGSTMPMLNKSDFEIIKIYKPNNDILKEFCSKMKNINENLINAARLTYTCQALKELILSKLATIEN